MMARTAALVAYGNYGRGVNAESPPEPPSPIPNGPVPRPASPAPPPPAPAPNDDFQVVPGS